MRVAIHQPHYLPWLPYFGKAAQCDVFVFLDHVAYQKNGVQNRNQVKTSQGPLWLTVPVNHWAGCPLNQTRIADRRWPDKHLQTLRQAYSRAPYRDEGIELIETLLRHHYESLADLSIAVTSALFQYLGISCHCVRSSEREANGQKEELILNLLSGLGATSYLSGRGASEYQVPEHFTQRGIELFYAEFEHPLYHQMHSQIGFLPHLSIIDLILNAGPGSSAILASSLRLPSKSAS
jgi:hypothetical protein